MLSWLSVKLVLPSNFCQAIYLKHGGDPNYILPFTRIHTHRRASTSSSTYLVYSDAMSGSSTSTGRWSQLEYWTVEAWSTVAAAGEWVVTRRTLQQWWCCSSGVNTTVATVVRAQITYISRVQHLYTRAYVLTPPHARSCLLEKLCSTCTCRNLLRAKSAQIICQHCACRAHRGDRTSITHVPAKNFSTHWLRTFLHTHTSYELFCTSYLKPETFLHCDTG